MCRVSPFYCNFQLCFFHHCGRSPLWFWGPSQGLLGGCSSRGNGFRSVLTHVNRSLRVDMTTWSCVILDHNLGLHRSPLSPQNTISTSTFQNKCFAVEGPRFKFWHGQLEKRIETTFMRVNEYQQIHPPITIPNVLEGLPHAFGGGLALCCGVPWRAVGGKKWVEIVI